MVSYLSLTMTQMDSRCYSYIDGKKGNAKFCNGTYRIPQSKNKQGSDATYVTKPKEKKKNINQERHQVAGQNCLPQIKLFALAFVGC
ncbi:hypothetical protein PVAP13_6NG259700 [Panicum virgatum]|uniref:Uncharacterized protein n=1 Tax=Panicum virgatum TaxID=38727 RepID=A0A8T0R3S9_PANVG|nr:hypothetical protein PVAP13_6NG259700 [Panicum virgatum]